MYRVAVTVPAASVTAALTDFPLYIDLATLPAYFWTHLAHADGRDIRVRAADDETELPFDLVTIHALTQTGALFVRTSLTNLADTVVWVHYGDSSRAAVAVDAVNGRNAVWADYHRVWLLAPDDGFVDHTGAGTPFVPTANTTNGNVSAFSQTLISPDTQCHEGVAWDGTYYYTMDAETVGLRKWTSAWVHVATNADPWGDTGVAGINHAADLEVVDGVLYVPMLRWESAVDWDTPVIARFSADDLSFIDVTDISAQGADPASICYVPAVGELYVISYLDGSTVWRYALADLSYLGAITLSETLTYPQGITCWREHLWISTNSSTFNNGLNAIYPVTLDGAVVGACTVQFGRTGWIEGLSHTDESLLAHFSTAYAEGYVWELVPLDFVAGGGVRLKANGFDTRTGSGKGTGLTRYTTWTIGISVAIAAKPAVSQAILSYTVNTSTDDTKRATIAWHQATDRFGLWNNADGWVDAAGAPSLNVRYRLHDVHDGTTVRTIYKDGAAVSDNTITAMPDAAASAIYLGIDDASAAQPTSGNLGFVYLRAEVLSAEWIAAEVSNLHDPGGFYGVDDEEASPAQALVTQCVALVVLRRYEPVAGEDLYDCPGASPGSSLCGPDPVLTWIEETQYVPGSPDTLVRVVSDIALPDPRTYYHGKKEPRVLEFGKIARRLSDVQGQWQGATMRWREAEVDRVLRGRLAAADTRALTRTDVVCRMIRESDWAQKLDARTMFIGHVTRVAPFGEDLSTELEAGDQLARAIDAQEITCPRRLLSPLYFPGLPVDQIGVPEPILYGTLSGALSAVTPPVLTGDPARGAFVDGGVQVWGFDHLPDPPSAPTGVALAEGAGGSIDLGDAPGDTFHAFVTAVDANGNESDPSTFAQLDAGTVPSVTISGNDKTITVSWDAPGSPAPAFHRVYLGWNYYGVVVVQMRQVGGGDTSAVFDNTPSFAEGLLDDWSQLATGAVRAPFTWYGYYAVSAIDAAGEETALSDVGTAFARGYRRPIHVEWEEVPGATAYRVYRKPHPGAAYDRRWEVVVAGSPPAGSPPVYSFDDDLVDTGVTYIADAPAPRGLVPVIYTGQETLTATGETWYRFLVASHAIAGIDEWYLDGVLEDPGTAGVDYLIPGWPGWTDRFGADTYRDLNGRRYTLIYARGPKGDALAGFGGSPVTAGAATSGLALNLRGIESSAAADGTGSLITDLHEQFLHWFINFGPLGDYQSGAWLPAPTWTPIADHCQIDTDSFRARATEAETFVAGGYVGGGQLREALSLRDWIARWCLSTDTRIGISASGQWRLTRQVPEPTTAVARTYTDVRHVQAGSLTIAHLDEEHWNALPYNYRDDPVAGAWEVADGLLVDAASVALYGQTRVGPSQDLYFVRAAPVATDILTRVLARHADPPLRVAWETIDLCGTLTELGEVIGLSSLAGTDVDAWTAFKLFVDGVVVDPQGHRTGIEARALVAPHLSAP